MVIVDRQWWHTSLITALGKQRKTKLCEFKATLDYMRLIQSKRRTEPNSGGSHFDMALRRETGRDMAYKPLRPVLVRVSIAVRRHHDHSNSKKENI